MAIVKVADSSNLPHRTFICSSMENKQKSTRDEQASDQHKNTLFFFQSRNVHMRQRRTFKNRTALRVTKVAVKVHMQSTWLKNYHRSVIKTHQACVELKSKDLH